MSSALTSPTGFFITTEWACWIKLIKCIGPDNAGLEVLGSPENL